MVRSRIESQQRNINGNVKTMDELRNLIFASIISADNDEFGLSEDDKQEIIQRHKLGTNWEYVLEPIADTRKRKMLVELFEEEELDK